MIFTLEALNAKHGDALLLHYGKSADEARLVIIDGGPDKVFAPTMKPRLRALKDRRTPDGPLPVELLMVSHIDDDHINGVLDLVAHLADLDENSEDLPYDIRRMWHNSFEDLAGAAPADVASASTAAQPASTGAPPPAGWKIDRDSAAILASVPQGRRLRDRARALSLDVNDTPISTASGAAVEKLGGQLTFTILGPNAERLAALKKKWQAIKKKKAALKPAAFDALVAEFVDDSVANLSSIVVLARFQKKSMLLTGDARGDDLLEALERATLLKKDKPLHVNLFKLPHHGSVRNAAAVLFERITADHYVASADGLHGNPDVATLELLVTARGSARYTIHLTNPVPRAMAFLKRDQAANGRQYTVNARGAGPSIRVDLLQKFTI